MDATQKQTYLLYSRGLMPSDLTPGSLHLDPANPIDNERKVFPYKGPVAPDRLRDIQLDEPCSLFAQASQEWLASAGILGLLKGELGPSKSTQVTVSGKRGRRLQLAAPEAFLNEVILTSDAARAWLSAKLSVLHRFSLLAKAQKALSRSPKIWMVTGVQYVEGGAVTSTANSTWTGSLRATVPMPDPTLVAAAAAAIPAVEAGGSATSNGGTAATYGHAEERVWAAQFRALNVEFRRKGEEEDGGRRDWIELREVKDLGRRGARVGGHQREQGGTEDGVSHARVAGVEEEDGDTIAGSEASAQQVLDAMLAVDWTVLDGLLDLQEGQASGEDEDDDSGDESE